LRELNRDGGRLGEDRGHLRVHVDHELVLRDVLLISDLHCAHGPHCERLAYHAVEDVDRPLPRYAVAVLVVGEVLFHLRVELKSRQDVVEGQALVLGAEQVGHPAALYIYNTRDEGGPPAHLRFFWPEMSWRRK